MSPNRIRIQSVSTSSYQEEHDPIEWCQAMYRNVRYEAKVIPREDNNSRLIPSKVPLLTEIGFVSFGVKGEIRKLKGSLKSKRYLLTT
jgi:hypothetical protein